MLVIERKEGESVAIENFEVHVLHCRNGRVKIGITAPKEVRIVRSELLSKQEKENGSDSTAIDLERPDARQPD